MSDYTKSTNFAAKDALLTGDPAKIVQGSEIGLEYDNVAVAVASKADKISPTFTGTVTAAALTVSGAAALGTLSVGGAATVVDGSFNILGSGDQTKKVKFEVDGLTTATTRTVTVPDANVSIPIVKRKIADEAVTSSTVLQDDDHLTFAIAANEEWIATIDVECGNALALTGVKAAMTFPAGSTNRVTGICIDSGGVDTFGTTTTSGTAVVAVTPANSEAAIRITVWVLNGATPGNVTLQWAQNASNGAALTFKKGSQMVAHRVA